MIQPLQLEKFVADNGLDYFKLAEFNNAVLAYRFIRKPLPEIHYATWQRDSNNALAAGHYFCTDNDALNERQSMRDFCVRSGLLRECDLMANDNLPDLLEIVTRYRNTAKAPEDKKILNRFVEQAEQVMLAPKGTIVDKDALINAQGQDASTCFEASLE